MSRKVKVNGFITQRMAESDVGGELCEWSSEYFVSFSSLPLVPSLTHIYIFRYCLLRWISS